MARLLFDHVLYGQADIYIYDPLSVATQTLTMIIRTAARQTASVYPQPYLEVGMQVTR